MNFYLGFWYSLFKNGQIAWENAVETVYDICSCWVSISLILASSNRGALSGVIVPVFIEFTALFRHTEHLNFIAEPGKLSD